MSLTNSTKSKVLLSLIKDVPGFMKKDGVRTLISNPDNAVFGYEDGAEAINAIDLSEKEKKNIDDKFESTSLDELFPNARLRAELEIARNTDRMKYKEFKDALIKLDDLSKEIDTEYGSDLDFLLDEIKGVADPAGVDAVKNMKVSILSIEKDK